MKLTLNTTSVVADRKQSIVDASQCVASHQSLEVILWAQGDKPMGTVDDFLVKFYLGIGLGLLPPLCGKSHRRLHM
jgi:hypothetical protein